MKTKTLPAFAIAMAILILAAGALIAGCGGQTTTTTTVAPTTTAPTTTQSTAPGGAAPVKFEITLSGAEVPPPVQTSASGTFSLFVEAGPTGQFNISYELAVKDIVDVTAAHIHLGAAGTEGPVIIPLFTGPPKSGSFTGVLAKGSILEKDLTGPFAGKTFADLTAAVLGGQTYVNVHTKANPKGKIRGQIVVAGAAGTRYDGRRDDHGDNGWGRLLIGGAGGALFETRLPGKTPVG